MIETLFFIFIILFLIIGMIYSQYNIKEGNSNINEKEKRFRTLQKDYFKQKRTKIYEDVCDATEFVKLDTIDKKLDSVGVCDFFSGKKIVEGFQEGFPIRQDDTEFNEAVNNCSDLNKSLKNINIDNTAASRDQLIKKLQQIPDILTINGENNEDKGCGYCYNKEGVGEILYGDSLGPYKNAGTGNLCEMWIRPGDLLKGGGGSYTNNYWKNSNDPEKMDFGGRQGVVQDSIKLHEQQICSKVKGCDDLDGEKSICGWCYMGRTGDGKGEGMVAKLDADGNKMGETKYLDDYCPWPGEVNPNGQSTDLWTGPNESSSWLKEVSSSESITDEDFYKTALNIKSDERVKWILKEKDKTIIPADREYARIKINEINDEIKAIKRIGQDGSTDGMINFQKWKNGDNTLDGYNKGSNKNNIFLYKCSEDNTSDKRIFLLNSYYELTDEQKNVIDALHDTHEFYKYGRTNMKIMGKKVTPEQIEDYFAFRNILDRQENWRIKEIFDNVSLEKNKVGCMENCNSNDINNGCQPYTKEELNKIFDSSNNEIGDKISKAFRSVPFSKDTFVNSLTGTTENPSIKTFKDVVYVWLLNSSNIENEKNNDEWKAGMRELWTLFINHVKKEHPVVFAADVKLPQKIVYGNSPLNDNPLKASNYETDELKQWRQDFGDGNPLGLKGSCIENDNDTCIKTAINSGSRLMISNGQCSKLEENFPCFVNWMGRKDISRNMPGDSNYDSKNPLGHNKKCYNQLWERETISTWDVPNNVKNKPCSDETMGGSDFENAMQRTTFSLNNSNKTLHSYTIPKWNKKDIPSVKVYMKNIRKIADDKISSHQYVPVYDKELPEDEQILKSAELMTKACYNRLPTLEDNDNNLLDFDGNAPIPYSCSDRFRKEDKNFPRPKKCIDYYWKKNTKLQSGETILGRNPGNKTEGTDKWYELNPEYDSYPDNGINTTWSKIWGMKNLPETEFKYKIHYELSNKDLDSKLAEMMTYLKGFTGKASDATSSNAANMYDKYLYYKRLIYETVDDDDIIWRNLQPNEKVLENTTTNNNVSNSGNKPWVKMCWGDFKDAMIKIYRIDENDVERKINKEPNGTLNIKKNRELVTIITGDNNRTLKKILGNDGKDIYFPFLSGKGIITETLYNKKWFPFWRFFEEKHEYYELTKYNINETLQTTQLDVRGTNYKRTFLGGSNADGFEQ